MSESAQDRNLPASARKIERAREQGQVARSRELTHFAVLGLGLLALWAAMPWVQAWCQALLAQGLAFGTRELANEQHMTQLLGEQGFRLALALLPLGVLAALLAASSAMLSGGWNFSWSPLAPRASKLSPLAGLTRIFSLSHGADLLKALVMAALIACIGFWWLANNAQQSQALLAMAPAAAVPKAGAMTQGLLLAVAAVLALFALIDVPLQRRMLQRQLRMSVQEMKQEMREAEGSGEVKGKRRVLMRQMAGRRTLAAVAKADLLVMNPSHYAVALVYDENKMAAPRVVAKGADFLALRLRQAAQEHEVPVLEHPPLARALYAHTAVDREIPARLFAAVAQVLAWVYQVRDLKRQREAARAARKPLVPWLPPRAPLPPVPADMDPLHKAAQSHAATASVAARAAASAVEGGRAPNAEQPA